LGTVLGISGETALALSLVKRVRELLLGLPGLAAWQFETAARVVRGMHREVERVNDDIDRASGASA
jgi:hypothetical protein